jgi:hypothetical protein
MFQSIKLRVLITVAFMLTAIYFFIPSIWPDMPAQLANLFPKNKIRLGLDL